MSENDTAAKAPTDSPVNRDALEFYFREHASLRAEIESDKQHLRKLEIYTVIGAGSVWAWLASNSPGELPLGWFIPIVFCLFGFLQTEGVVKDLKHRAKYLRNLEKAVLHSADPKGWENFLDDERGGKDPAVLNRIFWGAYFVVASVVFLLFSGLLAHSGSLQVNLLIRNALA
jgi:hypothetical protein